MNTGNWVTLGSALLIAMGWFITGHLSKLKDIAQIRLNHRLQTLKAFEPILSTIRNKEYAGEPFKVPGFLEQLVYTRNQFHLYGYKDEIGLMEGFIKAIEEEDVVETNKALDNLTKAVHDHIRKELHIPPVPLNKMLKAKSH